METFKHKNITEIMEESPKRLVILDKDGDYIFLERNGYYISGGSVKTPKDIISWVHHISGKSGISDQEVRQFIELSCRQTGTKLY